MKSIFYIFSSVLCLAAPLLAEEQPVRWFEGQYIISGVGSIPVLRARAAETVDQLSSEDLEIIDQTARILVMAPQEQADGGEQARIIDAEGANTLCRKLRQKHRLDLLAYRRGEGGAINRAIECSPNYEVSIDAVPNDPSYSSLWGMHQASGFDIDAPEAWDLSTGSDDTVVAVIDTGVDYNHPDLAANIWTNPGEIPGNGVDDDGNGYVDDIHGYNAIYNNGNPLDDHSHGTHCSGTIAGRGNNGAGVVGVNWRAKIVGCKFLSASGSGSTSAAVKCVDYVTNLKTYNHINVILSSNSWGGGGFSQALYDAIARANSAGILFVAAAGNSGINCNASGPMYPAGYAQSDYNPNGLTNVIGVAAMDSAGNKASFSNYGSSCASIAAPGVSIVSTVLNGQYGSYSGTSMATPHVAGALALLASYRPGRAGSWLKDVLLAQSRWMPSLSGIVSSSRFLNVYNMLSMSELVPTPTPSITPTPAATFTPTISPTPTLTPTATPTPQPGYWRISGVTSSLNGQAREGVKVRLAIQSGEFVTYTDASGKFSFYNVLGPSNFTLSAESAGYTWTPASGYFSADKQVNLSGQPQNYNVSIYALDQNLDPLAEVEVTITPGNSGVTNAQGLFSASVPYGSSYVIYLSKDGYHFKSDALVGNVYGDVRRRVVATQ